MPRPACAGALKLDLNRHPFDDGQILHPGTSAVE